MKSGFIIGVVLLWLFYFCLAALGIGLGFYGVYLAFCASVILGVVTLFFPPASLSFGVIQFFFNVNLPAMIVQWLTAHHG
jgi:hypothetical protein